MILGCLCLYTPTLPLPLPLPGYRPISVFFIKKKAYHKLGALQSATGTMHDQCWSIWGSDGVRQSAEAKLLAWISLHLHGRLLPKLIPKALGVPGDKSVPAETLEKYQLFLGEMLAATALGYNFGDGYLHGSFFLGQLQRRCQFEPGECVQIQVDSCPNQVLCGGARFHWRIVDATAAFKPVECGSASVAELKNTQPF